MSRCSMPPPLIRDVFPVCETYESLPGIFDSERTIQIIPGVEPFIHRCSQRQRRYRLQLGDSVACQERADDVMRPPRLPCVCGR